MRPSRSAAVRVNRDDLRKPFGQRGMDMESKAGVNPLYLAKPNVWGWGDAGVHDLPLKEGEVGDASGDYGTVTGEYACIARMSRRAHEGPAGERRGLGKSQG